MSWETAADECTQARAGFGSPALGPSAAHEQGRLCQLCGRKLLEQLARELVYEVNCIAGGQIDILTKRRVAQRLKAWAREKGFEL